MRTGVYEDNIFSWMDPQPSFLLFLHKRNIYSLTQISDSLSVSFLLFLTQICCKLSGSSFCLLSPPLSSQYTFFSSPGSLPSCCLVTRSFFSILHPFRPPLPFLVPLPIYIFSPRFTSTSLNLSLFMNPPSCCFILSGAVVS